jgi:hypothetical protein
MTRIARLAPSLLFITALSAVSAQQPPQFKANVKQKGSDGTTSTGTMYFGGAKIRTELASDGDTTVMLVDPTARSQYVLMPSDKIYMQMPMGQGPVSGPVPRPSDPINPCAGGSGNTDCVKGSSESVNGHNAIRWDYTNSDGVRTRAWISPRLRFAVKTEDDDGNAMELSNIAEGTQPANLFSIPSGYTKMDMGGVGGVGAGNATPAGRARGRGNANDPIAAMMANLPPEQQAQMAAAMRGEGAKGGRGTVAPTGSAWEKGNGFVVSMTITATQTDGPKTSSVPGSTTKDQSSYSIKWTGSFPLNFGSPSAGVPGGPGPQWTLLAGQKDIGTAAANKVPIALSVTTEAKVDRSWTSDCRESGIGELDPGTYQERMSATMQKSVSVTEMTVELIGQGNLKLSSDLKTYDLVAGIGQRRGQEVTNAHTETTGCRDKQLHKEDKTSTHTADYGVTLDLKGEPLPATVSTISGSKKMPLRIDGRELNANVTWTITPIR